MVWKGGSRYYYHPTDNWEDLSPAALNVEYGTSAFAIDVHGIRQIRQKTLARGLLAGQSAPPTYSLNRRARLKLRKWRSTG
jgi:hypothetical protein